MTHGWSWRAICGVALVVLGGLLLLAAFDVISAGAAWGIFWAAALILLGVFLISGPRRKSHEWRGSNHGAAVGDIRIGDTEFDLHDMETSIAAGQLRINLTKARIPAGETKIKVNGGMGKIEILVPSDLAISVRAEVGAGSITVPGQKDDGVGRQTFFASPGYDTAERRVKLELSLMVGETIVSRAS